MNRFALVFLFAGLAAGVLVAGNALPMHFGGFPDQSRNMDLFGDDEWDDDEWDDDEEWDDEDEEWEDDEWEDDEEWDDEEWEDEDDDEEWEDEEWEDEEWEDEEWEDEDRRYRRRNRRRYTRGSEAATLGHRRHVSLSMDVGLVTGAFGMSAFGMEVAVRVNDGITLMGKLDFMGDNSGHASGIAFDTGVRFYIEMKRHFSMYVDARGTITHVRERWWSTGMGVSGAFGVEYGTPWFRGYLESGTRLAGASRARERRNYNYNHHHRSRSDIRSMAGFQWNVLRVGMRVHF